MAALCSAQPVHPYMTALVPERLRLTSAYKVCLLSRWSLSSIAFLSWASLRRMDYLGEKFIMCVMVTQRWFYNGILPKGVS